MDKNSEFVKIYQFLKRNILILAITTILVAAVATVYSVFVMPTTYKATTSLVSNTKKNDDSQKTEAEINIQKIDTYNSIISDSTFLEKVKTDLKNKKASFKGKNTTLSLVKNDNSQVFKIEAEASKASVAVKISNKAAENLIKEVKKLFPTDQLIVVSKASIPESPEETGKSKIIIGAVLLGFVLGIFISFVRDVSRIK